MKTVIPVLLFFLLFGSACGEELTPQEKETVAHLKAELTAVQKEIEEAKQKDAELAGGLVKSLIAVRLEILKTNEALIQQRIHALESGAKVNFVTNVNKPDPEKSAQLEKDIQEQRTKVAEAKAYSDQYSGGLVKAMAETSVATAANTLVMLEQQYLIARYGLAFPSIQAPEQTKPAKPVSQAAAVPKENPDKDCLKIDVFDSSILDSNDIFTELAWKADIRNNCNKEFRVRVKFTIYDKDEFELDSDDEEILVPVNGLGKARGKMLISPPEKARRMARQGVSIVLR